MLARIGIALVMFAALAGGAFAQSSEYPAGPIDSKTLRTQGKAEALYERGDFKRALFIYENELATMGDKYAQYMTGYMYLMGQGAPADPVLASAWYRLAAERGSPEFITVRDRLLGTMNDAQRARSDAHYVALRKELSDVVLVMDLLRADLQRLASRKTGSRLGGSSTHVMIVDPQTGIPMSAAHYEAKIRSIAQMRLDFLTTRLGIGALDADLSADEVDALQQRVEAYVSDANVDTDALVDSR